MKAAAVLSICIALALQPARADESAKSVALVKPATVTIEPAQDGRRLIRLPAVEFTLRVAPACGTDQEFQSLSISVADTREVFTAPDFASDAVIETRLRIPGNQIGPLAVEDFCAVTASSANAILHVGAAFTAAISVRCDAGSQQHVAYDSLALDLELKCNLPGDDREGVAPDAAQRDKLSFPL